MKEPETERSAGASPRTNRLAVLVNPRAGAGLALRVWSELRPLIASPSTTGLRTGLSLDDDRRAGEVPDEVHAGADSRPGPGVSDSVRLIEESAPEAAEEALVEALEAGVDRVVVIGGDGTFSLAADVVAVAGAGERVVLGLVPAGTGSDLARSLGLPKRPAACLERALRGAPQAMDALELVGDDGRRRFVVNVLSAGVSGSVVERINALERRTSAAYLTEGLKALRGYTPASCRVEADGEPWHEGPLLLVAVANGTSFGGGMRIAPGAELDDGLADLVLAARVPGWQIPFLLPRLYLGRHLSSRYVRFRRAKSVRIEPAEGFPRFDLDGDPWQPGAVTVTVRPGAIRVAGPVEEPPPATD